jgi:hypothetical protein
MKYGNEGNEALTANQYTSRADTRSVERKRIVHYFWVHPRTWRRIPESSTLHPYSFRMHLSDFNFMYIYEACPESNDTSRVGR